MGRKIPAKKHRGVKDPLVQQARRLQSLKGKINAPPKDPDEQPVPQSLTRLFAFQNRDKTIKKKKDRKLPPNGGINQDGVGLNPVAQLKKLPGESGRGFSLRINSAVRALHNSLGQQDYPDDVESDDTKGERMTAQRERRQRKRRRAGAEGPAAEGGAASRAQRLALKKQAQKEKAAEEAAWSRRAAAQYERVQFGDVAHAPPALAPPRRARRPARPARRGLLLAALLGGAAGGGAGGAAGRGAGGAAGRGAGGAAGERARLDAVAAYRALKKERRMRGEAQSGGESR
ncbi:translation initiation factor IF-2 [Pararge aegeria]|uniref:translation initiation factor IF-2 n=1 Tax=Pararge aegeria TaxID=116150 RepID=UPI0019CFA044|nr:translation initiation factor IF-2 [Pararge aegeria]